MSENRLIVTLKKPYTFEGKEFTTVDLTPIEEWTCTDLIDIQNKFKRANAEHLSATDAIVLESNLAYCIMIAAKVTALPIEFFNQLPSKESKKIQDAITVFFNSED